MAIAALPQLLLTGTSPITTGSPWVLGFKVKGRLLGETRHPPRALRGPGGLAERRGAIASTALNKSLFTHLTWGS